MLYAWARRRGAADDRPARRHWPSLFDGRTVPQALRRCRGGAHEPRRAEHGRRRLPAQPQACVLPHRQVRRRHAHEDDMRRRRCRHRGFGCRWLRRPARQARRHVRGETPSGGRTRESAGPRAGCFPNTWHRPRSRRPPTPPRMTIAIRCPSTLPWKGSWLPRSSTASTRATTRARPISSSASRRSSAVTFRRRRARRARCSAR